LLNIIYQYKIQKENNKVILIEFKTKITLRNRDIRRLRGAGGGRLRRGAHVKKYNINIYNIIMVLLLQHNRQVTSDYINE